MSKCHRAAPGLLQGCDHVATHQVDARQSHGLPPRSCFWPHQYQWFDMGMFRLDRHCMAFSSSLWSLSYCSNQRRPYVVGMRTYSSPTKFIVIKPLFFFFNDSAATEIYTLSLHDALPI